MVHVERPSYRSRRRLQNVEARAAEISNESRPFLEISVDAWHDRLVAFAPRIV
jgi:hypothetical protein